MLKKLSFYRFYKDATHSGFEVSALRRDNLDESTWLIKHSVICSKHFHQRDGLSEVQASLTE